MSRAAPARQRAWKCVGCRGSRRCCWWTSPANCPAPCCSTVTSTSSRSSPAGAGPRPWEPVIGDGKLYGRGGADDGYAVFSSLAAHRGAQATAGTPAALRGADRGLRGKRQLRSAGASRGARRRRSASPRWSCAWMPAAATTTSCGARPRCAASRAARCACGCSPRACTPATATGIVPSAFRILAQLLARLEDPVTGDLLLEELQVESAAGPRGCRPRPPPRCSATRSHGKFPWVQGAHAAARTIRPN